MDKKREIRNRPVIIKHIGIKGRLLEQGFYYAVFKEFETVLDESELLIIFKTVLFIFGYTFLKSVVGMGSNAHVVGLVFLIMASGSCSHVKQKCCKIWLGSDGPRIFV